MADALRSVGAAATSAPIEQLETMLEMHARGAASSFGIIVFAPDSEDAPYLPVRLLQAVMKTKWSANPKLWLVTRGAQSPFLDRVHRVSIDQAALWGAARVVGEEHPELWGGLVDFDPISDVSLDADRFARHLAASDGEDQIAFRGSRRYVLRLMPASGEQKAETFAWRPDGAYLISGGLGDIGLRVAGELAAHGVRRLILVGRTPLPSREQWNETDPESKIGRRVAAVQALEAQGLSVHIATIDVSDEEQLREFLHRYKADAWPPIRGVIHAAGTLDDQLASSLSRADFDALLGPKLRGAQHLDRLLPDLDLFVLVSSIGAFMPQPGQANYAAANAALDAIAHDRCGRGLPALSIGWGVWENTGLVKGETGQRNVIELARRGIGTLSVERGAKIFAWLCSRRELHVTVLPIDWNKFRRTRAGRNSPIFKDVWKDAPATDTPAPKLKGRLAIAGVSERRQLLDGAVRSAVGKVLKISPSRIDPRKTLGAMGLNSLMAMELRNRLEAELERPLSATLAWNYPTVEVLVAYLADTSPALAAAEIKELRLDTSKSIQAVIDLSDEQALAALRAHGSARGTRQ